MAGHESSTIHPTCVRPFSRTRPRAARPGKRAVSLDPDFVGFVCPDLFVVGYGMDVAHAFRQLPFVGVVEKNP